MKIGTMRSLCALTLFSMIHQLMNGVGVVDVTNVTKDTIFAAIVCTELSIPNELGIVKSHIIRFNTLYVDAEKVAEYGSKNEFIERLRVWAIPPGQTAPIQSAPWDALHYDRNLWVTWDIKDLATAMLTGRNRVAPTKIAHLNIGSSTAPRYVGGKKSKQITISAKPTEAEGASGITFAEIKQVQTNNAESDLLQNMKSKAAQLTFGIDAGITKAKQFGQNLKQKVLGKS